MDAGPRDARRGESLVTVVCRKQPRGCMAAGTKMGTGTGNVEGERGANGGARREAAPCEAPARREAHPPRS